MKAPTCPPGSGCVTCADEGIPMSVVCLLPGSHLALCTDDDVDSDPGVEVMTDLVGTVEPGDRLLVHAGTALLRLDTDVASREAP